MSMPELPVGIATYQYKTIRITQWDKHGPGNEDRRRRGGNVDRCWTVEEVGLGTVLRIDDEDGDDYRDFRARAEPKVLEHLNQMGAEGWRLVQFVPTAYGEPNLYYQRLWWAWPLGTHIFCRPG